jgi:acetyltransferase/esterase
MEHEMRQYPASDLDVDALAKHVGSIVLASGRESQGHLNYRIAETLSSKLGLDMLEMPGGHLGCAIEPAEFAAELMSALASHA